MKMQEFECDAHGRFESLEDSDRDDVPCPRCGASSPWRISAPLGRVRSVEVIRGKYEPPPPCVSSTRELAEGMPLHEWKARNRRQRASETIDRVRSMRS